MVQVGADDNYLLETQIGPCGSCTRIGITNWSMSTDASSCISWISCPYVSRLILGQLVTQNAAQGATLPRYYHAEMCLLNETQLSQFLVSAELSHCCALYHLAVTTGMRLGVRGRVKRRDLSSSRLSTAALTNCGLAPTIVTIFIPAVPYKTSG